MTAMGFFLFLILAFQSSPSRAQSGGNNKPLHLQIQELQEKMKALANKPKLPPPPKPAENVPPNYEDEDGEYEADGDGADSDGSSSSASGSLGSTKPSATDVSPLDPEKTAQKNLKFPFLDKSFTEIFTLPDTSKDAESLKATFANPEDLRKPNNKPPYLESFVLPSEAKEKDYLQVYGPPPDRASSWKETFQSDQLDLNTLQKKFTNPTEDNKDTPKAKDMDRAQGKRAPSLEAEILKPVSLPEQKVIHNSPVSPP